MPDSHGALNSIISKCKLFSYIMINKPTTRFILQKLDSVSMREINPGLLVQE